MFKNKKTAVFSIVYILLVAFLCFYEWPYYIDAPGDLENLNNKVKVTGAHQAKGSMNLTYVKELKGTLPMLIIAKFNPSWDIVAKKDASYGNQNYEEMVIQNKILMRQSYTSAIKYAYEKAEKEINITNEKCYVVYIFDEAQTNLKVGNQILEVDGNKIKSCTEISKYVQPKQPGEKTDLLVLENNKKIDKNAVNIEYKNHSIIGIQIATEYEMETSPSYQFKFNENELGPSGGLMISLAVYNSLVKEDITGGYKIAGTGTLESDGSVGPIGGVNYKLKGAEKNKAKVFFVPSGENYEEAMKIKEEKNYKIKIVEVKTFDDAVEYLRKEFLN